MAGMAESLPPEQLQELLAGYVLGNLSPEEAESLRQLFSTYPELMGDVQQLQEVLSTMPYALPEAVPPDQLRGAILSATADEEGWRSPPQKRWQRLAVTWGSIAAVLLLALGLDNVRLRGQLSATQAQVAQQRDLIAMLQEPKTQLISLKGMAQMASASGRAVITPGHPAAILVLQNLPNLPEDRYYCLWAIVNGKKKVAIAEFEPNSQGNVFVKIPLASSSNITGLAVTIEVLPTPANPKGPMVMTSSL